MRNLILKVLVTREEYRRWNAYVDQNNEASFFHLTTWKDALLQCFNLKSYYLFAEEEGKVVGICPLMKVKDSINGCRLMSVPIGVYGGIVADNSEIAQSLYKKACEIAGLETASHVEFRNVRFDIYGANNPANFLSKETHATFQKELPRRKEECLNQVPRKARADIRAAVDKGLEIVEDDNALKICYSIYATNQKRLGSPVPPYQWFKALQGVFKENCKIHLITFRKKTIGAVMSFLYKNQILPFYGGTLKKYYHLHPAGFMYLKLQEWAVEKGLQIFDFGRSRINSGAYHFKINQGFSPQSLNYHLAVLDQETREKNLKKATVAFQRLSKIIKWVPAPLDFVVGPLTYSKFMP